MDTLAFAPKAAAIAALIFGNFLIIAAQTDSVYRLPAGTHIRLKMDAEINSRVASRVTGVRHAAARGRDGQLELVFERMLVASGARRIDGTLATPIVPETRHGFSLVSVIGGTIVGTALGAATGSTAAGTAAGAGAGIGLALLHKGHDIRIKPDQEFEIELRQEVILPV